MYVIFFECNRILWEKSVALIARVAILVIYGIPTWDLYNSFGFMVFAPGEIFDVLIF